MENEYEVITETYYRCPKCHKAYKALQEAEECLLNHAYPEEIIDYTYHGYGVPTEITVKLSNGNAAVYQLYMAVKGGQNHE